MEARLKRLAALAAVLLVAMGARHRTANFVVETPDPRLAVQFAEAAEKYRRDLAVEWLGQAMPNWSQPCMMTVQVGPQIGAGGATTFVFDHGEVFGWRMTIQGSAERVVDSVLPHEITHMVFASFFRRPVPRWADEGGATSVECASEKTKHRTMLVQFLRTGRGIAFSQMFAMTEYPRDVMPLYAQSYSLAEYLIQRGGRRKYIQFLADGMRDGQWSAAVQRHYGVQNLSALQNTWVAWVGAGFPESKPAATAVAAATATTAATAAQPAAVAPTPGADSVASARRLPPEPNLIYRVPNKPATPAMTTGLLSESQPLPSTGWRPVGARATSAAAPSPPPSFATSPDPAPATVTRPQTMEPSRQIILE